MFDRSKRSGEIPASAPEQQPAAASAQSTTRVREAAVIGPSIRINGDLRGEEDLIVQGEVHGTVQLSDHSVTVGSEGKLFADVYAHAVIVEGKVEGDLYGSERVVVKRSGDVQGNIVSPRVSLEDGGRFKGSVEMDAEQVRKAFGKPAAPPVAAEPAKKAEQPKAGSAEKPKPEEAAKRSSAG